MPSELIDTAADLKAFLDRLPDCTGKQPSLYVDLEGNKLSRNGTLSLITILVEPRKELLFIDDILESKQILKVFFDIRRDSDALYSLYGIRVSGIEDLQLMELATRDFSKRLVNGLAKCIERDSMIRNAEKQQWQTIKSKGLNLFDPKRGGSYAVFDQRPLSPEIRDYCAQDAMFMPHLREVYRAKLCDAWWKKVEAETEARIRLSQSSTFDPNNPHMAEGPPAWLN